MKPKIAENLNRIMKERGISGTELARRSGIQQQTIHRITSGRVKEPRRSNVRKLAAALNVTTSELFGSMPKGHAYATATKLGCAIEGISRVARIPLIDIQKAEGPDIEDVDLSEVEEWITCPVFHHGRAYAVRTSSDAMTPLFHQGDTLIIDPDAKIKPNSYAAIRDTDNHTIIRQVCDDNGRQVLQALNPEWPDRIVKMTDKHRICGVVICRITTF